MSIDPTAFSAFVKVASAVNSMDADTPTDYLATRLAATSLFPELLKSAAPLVHALEAGGLGVLAAPSIHTLRDPNATTKEKQHAKFETAGLGVLAAHPLYELGSSALSKLKALK